VFHKTAGCRHASIPDGIEAITALGRDHGYTVVATDDPSVFAASDLPGSDVVVFLNATRDVLDAEQEAAMEGFVAAGGGFVGIHSAADTECEWSWYGGLVGAYFDSHPPPQTATVNVVAPEHPTMQGLPASFGRFDEWYNFRSLPGPEATIVATFEESSHKAATWAHLIPSRGLRSTAGDDRSTPVSATLRRLSRNLWC
jgi:type 1 glutamine amidotransferase